MQLTFEGKTIDQLAIELIQAYEPPEGYYGGFSGGADSQCIYDLTKRAGVKCEWHFNDSPIDTPVTREFIRINYPDVIFDNHAKGFFSSLFITNGLPLRTQRWCCRYIKECGGAGRVKILGMRKEESDTRSGYSCFMPSQPYDAKWLLPVINWTDKDRYQYLSERGIKTNPLYNMGFTRTGCVLCPNQNAGDVKLSLMYFPKIVNLWKHAADRYIKFRWETDTRKKPTFRTGEEYFNWWIKR